MAPPSTRPHLELIQIFRGAAATLVVLYHVGSSNHVFYPFLGNAFRFGHSGIDFFFVLSGFIMVYVNWEQAGRAREAGRFLLLRAARVYPIYWIVLAVTVAAFRVFGQTPALTWAPDSTLEARTLGPAILLTYSPTPIIPPVWTLTYELAFYLFFASFFLCGARAFTLLTALWAAAIVVQWSGVAHLGTHEVLLRPIVLEFFLGCVAALAVRRAWMPHLSRGWLLVPLGMLVGLARAEFLGVIDSYTWYAIPYLLFILIGGADDHATHRRYPALLVLLGEASYATYLIHFGLITIFAATIDAYRPLASLAPDGTLIVLTLAILAAGTAVHLTVERPLLRAVRRRV